MLRAVPKGWFNTSYELFDDDSPVGQLNFAFATESASMEIGGESFKLYREGWMSGKFLLESESSGVIAGAEKPSAFERSFEVGFDGRSFLLEAESAFFRKFVLYESDSQIGSISPDYLFTRRSTIDLPADIPLPVRAFMFRLVAILWKRASDSAAAGAN